MFTSTPIQPQGPVQFTLDFVPALAADVALELDLFSHIHEGHQTVPELAAACGVPERGLRPVLACLRALGLLQEQDGRYQLVPLSRNFLTRQSPGQMIPVVRHQIAQMRHWWRLREAVMGGSTPLTPVEGEADEGMFFGAFSEGLFAMNAPAARVVAQELRGERALDVGCGSAVWSLALAARLPELRVTAVDRPLVLEKVTRDCVAELGAGDRYDLRPGNFREMELEEGGYDVVFLGHILHNEGREASRVLLRRAASWLRPGGQLVVAEMVDDGGMAANLFDLNMLLWTEKGCVLAAAELEEMLAEAGFSGHRWLEAGGPSPILIGTR